MPMLPGREGGQEGRKRKREKEGEGGREEGRNREERKRKVKNSQLLSVGGKDNSKENYL